jgi:hypothetical protein
MKFWKNKQAGLSNPNKAFVEDPRNLIRRMAKTQAGLYALYAQQLDTIKFRDKTGK